MQSLGAPAGLSSLSLWYRISAKLWPIAELKVRALSARSRSRLLLFTKIAGPLRLVARKAVQLPSRGMPATELRARPLRRQSLRVPRNARCPVVGGRKGAPATGQWGGKPGSASPG